MYNDALTELWDVPAMKTVVGGLPEGPDTADFSIFRSVAAIISKEEVSSKQPGTQSYSGLDFAVRPGAFEGHSGHHFVFLPRSVAGGAVDTMAGSYPYCVSDFACLCPAD